MQSALFLPADNISVATFAAGLAVCAVGDNIKYAVFTRIAVNIRAVPRIIR